MIQAKKAIGFFVSFAFLVFGFFYFSSKGIEPFSDFALLEWQSKLAIQGIFHLPYNHAFEDPNYSFFPLPNLFFQQTKGFAHSTFPNLYPILISPILKLFGISGVTIIHTFLFTIGIFLFHQIQKNVISTLLLLYGSTIPIYIFLFHETIFIFFLEISALYLFHKCQNIFAGMISALILWIRPEMSFVLIILPICFENKTQTMRFYLSMAFCFSLLALGNLFLVDSLLPLRIAKNSDMSLRSENVFYLAKIWMEQVPIFILFCFYFLKSLYLKEIKISNFLIIIVTMVMVFLAPNSGGHNTPRYLFGLVPLYVLLLNKEEKNPNPFISYRWIFLITLISIYTICNLHFQMKELKKISKFQSNTLSEIRKIKDSVIIFSNPDFAFVSLPLLEEKKDLLLLRKDFNSVDLANLLTKKNIKTFTFLELPPSPVVLPNNFRLPNCSQDCSFQRGEIHPLPNALLPITQTSYKRN
ncbi:hypothetical protein EHQ31_06905 [Leptospira montravelensis]|uniref:Glycosyltransferase RgtA/B/C/D-like domain-containing protein n=1 Tax=Leptospira montravelensis TaxID=2484961 RepID=A0ABY2LW23_9LEPT|nr:hypothetical protein [Leptospira montravelensis]TGK78130.1 hypothetical protein EHQ19_18610 [Leptospira montravelensis]TGL03823.1 hypothetical protein EHQ31_06905 [Leptospira montravelensis]